MIRKPIKCPQCGSGSHKTTVIKVNTNPIYGRKCNKCGRIFTRVEAEKVEVK
jgi:uncharacterized Zn finger protein